MSNPQFTYVNTTFTSSTFISRRCEVTKRTTLLYQLNVLKKTGRYDAFKLQWHPSYDDKPDVPPVPNHLFWDSDVAKWIEGACYAVHSGDVKEVSDAVNELVEMIRSAQQEDGYLNIHYTMVEPGSRFTNLRDMHELYNAGHLIEAALAHQHIFKNDRLMEPILRYVELLSKKFGPGETQMHAYPGHPEIELALLRLYESTGNRAHLNLAKYFIEERGNPTGQNGKHFYDFEAAARGERDNERPVSWPGNRCFWYMQAHEPIVEQKTIEGHSVRAMYLLTAVADLVRTKNIDDSSYRAALMRLWNNMVERKMYLTGGIGAQKQWEGFGIDYFLPSGTDEGGCYAETCAAIGVMMLAERLLQIDLDGRFGDVLELCFYNAVLTGMSASGQEFTYVNQLASTDNDLSQRAKWFTCACCPPNVTRLLGYIGGYLWTPTINKEDSSVEVNIHMYTSARLTIPVGEKSIEIEQLSNWPWEGSIEVKVRNPSNIPLIIRVRIPGWAHKWMISPKLNNPELEKGYLTIPAEWLRYNNTFRLDIDLKPRFVTPHPYTNQDIVAIARGPILYCLEDVDNGWVNNHFKDLLLDINGRIEETPIKMQEPLEPYVGLTVHNAASFMRLNDQATPELSPTSKEQNVARDADQLHFIPYALRANRGGRGQMRVGIKRRH